MDFAAAVNAEAKAVKQAGADVVQLDEPWLETAPEVAARYAVRAIDRALEGVPGPTAVHLCFGYAELVKDKSRGRYAFLEPLADSAADQISIEAAQPKLDLGVLRGIARQTVILGVLDLGDPTIETPEQVAARIRRGAGACAGRAADPGAGLRHEVPAARDRLRQAAGAGRGCRDRARRAFVISTVTAREDASRRALPRTSWTPPARRSELRLRGNVPDVADGERAGDALRRIEGIRLIGRGLTEEDAMTLPPVRAIGIAWYRREDWDEVRQLFVDRDSLPVTYDDWLAEAEEVLMELSAQGHSVEKAPIDPRAFAVWCAMRGLDLDAKARAQFANDFVARKYREQS